MSTSINKLEKQITMLTERLDQLTDQFANFKSNTAQHILLSEKVNLRTHRILDNMAEIRSALQKLQPRNQTRQKP